jgi:hypothetical protein
MAVKWDVSVARPRREPPRLILALMVTGAAVVRLMYGTARLASGSHTAASAVLTADSADSTCSTRAPGQSVDTAPQLVQARCYQPKGRGFELRIGPLNCCNLPNPSSRRVTPGLNPSLTEISFRNFPGR